MAQREKQKRADVKDKPGDEVQGAGQGHQGEEWLWKVMLRILWKVQGEEQLWKEMPRILWKAQGEEQLWKEMPRILWKAQGEEQLWK